MKEYERGPQAPDQPLLDGIRRLHEAVEVLTRQVDDLHKRVSEILDELRKPRK